MSGAQPMDGNNPRRTRRQELWAFLFVTILLAPLISTLLVGGYGLLIWISHMFGAPPGLPVD